MNQPPLIIQQELAIIDKQDGVEFNAQVTESFFNDCGIIATSKHLLQPGEGLTGIAGEFERCYAVPDVYSLTRHAIG
ncbi:MAG: hypothetical protein A2X81_17890 [Desulfobacterales bacterium GWB2_56_26]|nr:MAG: hypothetical protein A2X81_17890 [Desulfobacterales bacterium GWB2_56_26]